MNIQYLLMVICIVSGYPELLAKPLLSPRRHYREVESLINSNSPSLSAGSLGSYGTHLGLGVVRVSSQGPLKQPTIPHLSIAKGFSWPIILGLSAGRTQSDQVLKLSGFFQCTLFEGFKQPALAGRYIIAQTKDPAFAAESETLSLLVSYGLIQRLVVHASIDWHRMRQLEFKDQELATAPIRASDRTQSFGIELAVAPLIKVAAEVTLDHREPKSSKFNISYLL